MIKPAIRLNWTEIGQYVAAHPQLLLSKEEFAKYQQEQEINTAINSIKWGMYDAMFNSPPIEVPANAFVGLNGWIK